MSAAHAKLRKHFPGLSPDDEVLEDCSCAYAESTHGVPQQGHLWVTSRHLCFHAKILSRKTQIQLRLEDIKAIEKQNTACVVPNALLVVTKENKKYFFTSLMHRDQTFDAVQRGMPAHDATQHSETPAAESITPPVAVSEKDAEAEAATEAKVDEDSEHEQTQKEDEDRQAAHEEEEARKQQAEAEAKAKADEEEQQRKEQQAAAEEALQLRAEEERKLDEARRAKEREEQEEAQQKVKQQAQEQEREEEFQRQAAKRAQEEEEKEKERAAAAIEAKRAENKKEPELSRAATAVATKQTTESPAVRSTLAKPLQPKPQQIQPSADLLQRHQVLVVLFAVLLAFVLSRLLF